jgi:hypothetical protein
MTALGWQARLRWEHREMSGYGPTRAFHGMGAGCIFPWLAKSLAKRLAHWHIEFVLGLAEPEVSTWVFW